MDAVNKAAFIKWAEKNNWMKVNEATSPTGPTYSYITPTGDLRIVIFDLKGNLYSIGEVVPGKPSPLAVS